MTALTYTRCPAVPTVSALAHRLGLIEEELRGEPGIEAAFASVGFSPKVDYGHDDRFWLRNAGHAPALWKFAKGVKAKFVGLSFLEGRYPVLALASSGIGSVADLKGKRLALVGRRDAAFDLMVNQQLKIYRTALATAGLTLEDVTLVELDQSPPPVPASGKPDFFSHLFRSRLALLEAGTVDAATAAIPPDAGHIPALNILYDTRQHPDPRERVNPSVLRGLVVSEALIAERRDLVVRILARLLEAADWALAHPLEAIRLIAEDFDLPPERLAATYESLAEGIQLGFDAKRLEALAVQKDFLLEHGLIDRDIDLAEHIDTSLLEEARALYASRRQAASQPLVSAG
ncbi:MAG TPA: ABC transporter substrate-binding protein [Novosphingobium sp.]|nr:ABC transporter substrate-binding protein [Novosphingobium sp.]HZV10180.1 ABC transporter substrate-binding protein [Novosphingobium sp.]